MFTWYQKGTLDLSIFSTHPTCGIAGACCLAGACCKTGGGCSNNS